MPPSLDPADTGKHRETEATGATKTSVGSPEPGAASAEAELPHIVVDPVADGLSSRFRNRGARGRPGGASRPIGGRLIWLAAGVVTAVALAVLIAVVLLEGRSSGGSSEALLTLEWPAAERSDGAVFLDGRQRELPQSGPVEYSLRPGSYRLVIVRDGYEQIEQEVSLRSGRRLQVKPVWARSRVRESEPAESTPAERQPATPPLVSEVTAPERTPSVPLDDVWLQDLDEAKRRAAEQGKDIFLVFEGSDWNEVSMRTREEILTRREFRQWIEPRFVLVSIDFPHHAEAQQWVDDPQRNQRIAESYRVTKYPTVVLTDAEGRRYSNIGYHPMMGLDDFMGGVEYEQSVRELRDRLFLEVEKAEGEAKLAAIAEAARLLKDMALANYYRATLDEWQAVVERQDADNLKGALEVVFELRWFADRIDGRGGGEEALRGSLAALDDWKGQFEFRNRDRAASMHLEAANDLAAAGQEEEALDYIEQAYDYDPRDATLRLRLEEAEAFLCRYGRGTGFAVAADGYVLTNYHVVEEKAAWSVRLPSGGRPVPAQVVAKDAERDLALLKVPLPNGIELPPLHIVAEEVGQGTDIAVFGFPKSETINVGLKLIGGVIGAEPDQGEPRRYPLDCQVYLRNSGGPVCDAHGNVVGMVGRKLGGQGVDSYDMAVPGQDLRDFLKRVLPQYQQQDAAEPGQTPLDWGVIEMLVRRSVVVVVK